eukprot:364392-Chlamydomonas_euryale.AAC.6
MRECGARLMCMGPSVERLHLPVPPPLPKSLPNIYTRLRASAPRNTRGAPQVVFSSCILYNNYVTLQQRRVQAQLAQEHADRIRMVADLQSSLRHKDEFISVIGHELRTPLNAVIKLSSAIAGNFGVPAYSARHRLWMETITCSARHLLGIINDIITMKAARSGIHLKQELVHMGAAVAHVLRVLTPMAQRDVVVEKIVAKTLPPIVADERRVIQVRADVRRH